MMLPNTCTATVLVFMESPSGHIASLELPILAWRPTKGASCLTPVSFEPLGEYYCVVYRSPFEKKMCYVFPESEWFPSRGEAHTYIRELWDRQKKRGDR